MFFNFASPHAFETRNVAQIILDYHVTKQFLACIDWSCALDFRKCVEKTAALDFDEKQCVAQTTM